MKWLRREDDGEGGNKEIEIKPEDFSKALKPELDSIKSGLSTELDAKLAPIAAYIAKQQEKDDAAEADRKRQQEARSREDSEIKPEDYLTDPDGVMDKKLGPIVNVVRTQSAIIMRDKVLGKMEYYASDPEFQSKVDALIDAQPIENRANAAVIMNAYKTVHYDFIDKIKEGKVKTLASAANMNGNSTGGHSGNNNSKEDDKTLSSEEKAYARKMGLTEEQWIQGRRELEYV